MLAVTRGAKAIYEEAPTAAAARTAEKKSPGESTGFVQHTVALSLRATTSFPFSGILARFAQSYPEG